MDDFLRWNDRVVSAKSCIFTIAGVPFIGITALKYGDSLDMESVHGARRDGSPIGFTSGEYNVDDFSMSMLKDVFMKKFLPLIGAIGAANGSPGAYGGNAAVWPLIAQYVEAPFPPDTDVISGCRVVGAADSFDAGAGALVTEIKLKAMTLTRNGLCLYDRTRLP